MGKETNQNKMRLLFFIQKMNGGGAQRVMANLLNAFVQKGHEVSLAYNTKVECVFDLEPNIQLYNTREGCIPNTFWKKNHLYRKTRTLYNIRKIAKKVSPDVAVSFLTPNNCDVIFSLLGTKIPVVASEHTNLSVKKGLFTDLIRKYVYPLADVVTVLTRCDYAHYKKVIKNAVYMPNPSDPPNHIRDNQRKKVVFAAGSVDRWNVKGFDSLARIWSNLYKEFPEWELQIAGDGSKASVDYLSAIMNKKQCHSYKFLGFRKDVSELMQQSEVYCMTSRYEGLPMVLIEAMNAGCCCLSYDCKTGPAEIIRNDFSGILISDQNEQEFKEKLREVLANCKYRHYLASNSYKTVTKYRTEEIVRRWTILFDKLIKTRDSR